MQRWGLVIPAICVILILNTKFDNARVVISSDTPNNHIVDMDKSRSVEDLNDRASHRPEPETTNKDKRVDLINPSQVGSFDAEAVEQKDREALAAKLLSTISLKPTAKASWGLSRFGASIEMRGSHIDKLIKLQTERAWLAMLSDILGKPLDEYPDEKSIEGAVDKLSHERFKILIRTKFVESLSEDLYLITFPQNGSDMVDWVRLMEKHPDGIGYLHDWSPDRESIVLAVGTYKEIGGWLRDFEDGLSKEIRNLEKKRDLEELTADALALNLAILRKRAYDSVSQWATIQPLTGSNGATQRPVNERNDRTAAPSPSNATRSTDQPKESKSVTELKGDLAAIETKIKSERQRWQQAENTIHRLTDNHHSYLTPGTSSYVQCEQATLVKDEIQKGAPDLNAEKARLEAMIKDLESK